jgi:hypothetical protein
MTLTTGAVLLFLQLEPTCQDSMATVHRAQYNKTFYNRNLRMFMTS